MNEAGGTSSTRGSAARAAGLVPATTAMGLAPTTSHDLEALVARWHEAHAQLEAATRILDYEQHHGERAVRRRAKPATRSPCWRSRSFAHQRPA